MPRDGAAALADSAESAASELHADAAAWRVLSAISGLDRTVAVSAAVTMALPSCLRELPESVAVAHTPPDGKEDAASEDAEARVERASHLISTATSTLDLFQKARAMGILQPTAPAADDAGSDAALTRVKQSLEGLKFDFSLDFVDLRVTGEHLSTDMEPERAGTQQVTDGSPPTGALQIVQLEELKDSIEGDGDYTGECADDGAAHSSSRIGADGDSLDYCMEPDGGADGPPSIAADAPMLPQDASMRGAADSTRSAGVFDLLKSLQTESPPPASTSKRRVRLARNASRLSVWGKSQSSAPRRLAAPVSMRLPSTLEDCLDPTVPFLTGVCAPVIAACRRPPTKCRLEEVLTRHRDDDFSNRGSPAATPERPDEPVSEADWGPHSVDADFDFGAAALPASPRLNSAQPGSPPMGIGHELGEPGAVALESDAAADSGSASSLDDDDLLTEAFVFGAGGVDADDGAASARLPSLVWLVDWLERAAPTLTTCVTPAELAAQCYASLSDSRESSSSHVPRQLSKRLFAAACFAAQAGILRLSPEGAIQPAVSVAAVASIAHGPGPVADTG